MTDEERREYKRKWYQQNKEKCKEYKRKSARKKALEDIESGKVVLVQKMVFAPVEEANDTAL